jgi:integrase/recombinase XerD
MRSCRGLMIKTLFLTGARVSEFVQVRTDDLYLDSDAPQIHLVHTKSGASRYVPILPSLAQELRTHLEGRRHGYLFESNRHTHYSVRTVQTMIAACAREAGITKRVYPHLLRHSIATILLESRVRADRPGAEIPWPPATLDHPDLCRDQCASAQRQLLACTELAGLRR